MDAEAADMTAEGGPAPEAMPDELATADMSAVATDTNGAAPAEAVADSAVADAAVGRSGRVEHDRDRRGAGGRSVGHAGASRRR